jgi:hypothetical protein
MSFLSFAHRLAGFAAPGSQRAIAFAFVSRSTWVSLPQRPAEALCFRRTEIPGKKDIKAIRCLESGFKAYRCQDSDDSTRPRALFCCLNTSSSSHSTDIRPCVPKGDCGTQRCFTKCSADAHHHAHLRRHDLGA